MDSAGTVLLDGGKHWFLPPLNHKGSAVRCHWFPARRLASCPAPLVGCGAAPGCLALAFSAPPASSGARLSLSSRGAGQRRRAAEWHKGGGGDRWYPVFPDTLVAAQRGRRAAFGISPCGFTYPGRQQAVITNAGGWRGIESGPALIRMGPQRGRCRDEVWRYGCGEKPIQNPYGHEKTRHFTAP